MDNEISQLIDALIESSQSVSAGSGRPVQSEPLTASPHSETAASQDLSEQLERIVRIAASNAPVANTTHQRNETEVDSVAIRIEELQRAATAQSTDLRDNTAALSKQAGPSQASFEDTAGEVAKSVGGKILAGLGPVGMLVTGLVKLFGRDGPTPLPLTPYAMPEAVRVDAGLAPDRSVTSVRYGQSGLPQAVPAGASQANITVNVNAMDSRSFLDHSEEIARAVREAMLHSHSLNDVVADI